MRSAAWQRRHDGEACAAGTSSSHHGTLEGKGPYLTSKMMLATMVMSSGSATPPALLRKSRPMPCAQPRAVRVRACQVDVTDCRLMVGHMLFMTDSPAYKLPDTNAGHCLQPQQVDVLPALQAWRN